MVRITSLRHFVSCAVVVERLWMFLELSKSPMVAINPFPLVKDISPIKRILIVGFQFFPSFFSRGWNSVWNRYGIDVFSISVPHENP